MTTKSNHEALKTSFMYGLQNIHGGVYFPKRRVFFLENTQPYQPRERGKNAIISFHESEYGVHATVNHLRTQAHSS